MKSFKRLFKYIFKYWYLLLISLLLSIIIVSLTLYIPILIGQAIDNMIGINNVNFEIIKSVLIKIIISVLVIALCQWITSILNNNLSFIVTKNIRCDAFNKLHSLPLSYIDSNPHGEILNKVIADISVIGDGLLLGLNGFFTGILTIIGTIIFMVRINYIIALVVIVLTPLSLFVSKFITSKTYKMFKDQAKSRGKQTKIINEMVGNIKTVLALHIEDDCINEFNDSNNDLSKKSLNAIFFSSLTNPTTRFVNSLVYAFVGIISALICISLGTISVGNLSTLLAYANQYTKPFNDISQIISELQNSLACASRVFDFIDSDDEIKESENAITLDNPSGNIEIKDVRFSYNENVRLIEDFNLSVLPGQKIAIVGPTGCGKTTIINLLMRFYDVNSGEILIDNVNIKDLSRSSLRDNYGMVLQDTWIRNDTILNNLTLGDTSHTMDEIIEVCKACHCDSFIRRLPDKYNTLMSEDGGNLSTGQKQLLCIARVMLSNPKMLILDEATSNIDTLTEKQINLAFDKLMLGKTSFIVAHRLSTILSADCIIVMKDGHIMEKGTHKELLSKNGLYSEIYNSQFNH